MGFFKKRETLTQNLTYMGMMAAVNVVFVLLTTLVPYLLFLLVFVLPLTNCIVTIFCKKRYFIIYAVATIALCFAVTPWNISDTIFYVIPSIITGFIFGLFYKIKIPSIITILLIMLIQVGLTYASLPIIKLITQIDMIDVFAKIFNVNTHPYLNYLAILFVGLISLIQTCFAYLVIKLELPKMGENISEQITKFYIIPSANIISVILSIISIFIYGPLAYLFAILGLVLTIYEIIETCVKKAKIAIILIIVGTFISFFIFASCYAFIAKPFGLLLICVWFIVTSIIVLINNYCHIRNQPIQ